MSSIPRPITVAQIKLAALLAQHANVSRLAQAIGGQPATLRLLLAGGSRPKAETIDRLTKHGIQPSDWFVIAAPTNPEDAK